MSDLLAALQLPNPFDVNWTTLVNWSAVTNTALKILLALVLAWIAYRVLIVLIHRLERSVASDDPAAITLHGQRIRTLAGLARSVGIVLIVLLTLFMVLGSLGLNIGPLLATAGVAGLAISFGAQSLVKDIITGLFILFENQFGVGDVIRVGDVSGGVERMTLRVTVLRDIRGTVHVIPNGTIDRVSNLTRSWSRVVFEVGVAYKEDADRVMDVMRDVGRQLWDDPNWRPMLVEEITVPGIESFGDSAVNIRIMAKTVPLKQWDVARELRRRLKHRFDEEEIEIPFPHQTFYWGDGQMPPAFAGEGDQLRASSYQQEGSGTPATNAQR